MNIFRTYTNKDTNNTYYMSTQQGIEICIFELVPIFNQRFQVVYKLSNKNTVIRLRIINILSWPNKQKR